MRAGCLVLAFVVAGCEHLAGLEDVHAASDGRHPDVNDAPGDAGACHGVTLAPADEGTEHMPDETPIVWNANPPASGTHYPDWVKWQRTFTEVIPRGYWVHNLEHGGVVFLYHCTGCTDQIAALTATGMAMGSDADCASPITARWIVVNDPTLPSGVTFAAVAWDHSYTADCINPTELTEFAFAHRRGGPENTNCGEGQYPP